MVPKLDLFSLEFFITHEIQEIKNIYSFLLSEMCFYDYFQQLIFTGKCPKKLNDVLHQVKPAAMTVHFIKFGHSPKAISHKSKLLQKALQQEEFSF